MTQMRELNGKYPHFLVENLGTKSLMKRFLYQEPILFWEGCFLEFAVFQAIGYLQTMKLCWSSEN